MSGSPRDERPPEDDPAPEELTGQGLAGVWSAKRRRGRRAVAEDADPLKPGPDEPGPTDERA